MEVVEGYHVMFELNDIGKIAHAIMTGGMIEGKMREIRQKEWNLKQEIAKLDGLLAKAEHEGQ